MPRKHADGHILNDQGEREGRWDDNRDGVRQWAMSHNRDPDAAEEAWRRSGQSHRPVVKRVEGYYEANRNRADRGHGENWLRVLVAFGQYQERGIKPYSAAEARESAKVWRGWEEVALALEGLESTNFEFAHGYDPAASAYRQEGTKDGYIPPDSDKWLNPRQDEGAPEPNTIAPEHKDQFIAYIERERDLVAEVSGSGHPAVKNREHDAYIEDVKAGGPVHSQIMFLYEQFLGWLRGEYGQRTAKETTLWADGTEDDHTSSGAAGVASAPSDAAAASSLAGGADAAPEPPSIDPAEQDAYAAEVERYQAAREAGDADAQQGFDEWRRDNKALFAFNGTYVMDTRTGCYIPFDKVAKQRGELTAENVRYRLDCDRPDGVRQISWLALNYEGCLCWLPHYDGERTDETRMIPAEKVPDFIAEGWRVLTDEEYAENQRAKHSREDRFSNFRLYVQYDPQDNPLGVCPTQGDPGIGEWQHNAELFARLQGGNAEALLTTHLVNVPQDLAAAINAGDWAEVARLAQERAG